MIRVPGWHGSDRLIVIIRCAYWVALMLMAAMTVSSFLLLQHLMAGQQRDETLLQLANSQKALSQRVVFLALATKDLADGRDDVVEALHAATVAFEQNYDRMLQVTSANESKASDETSLDSIFFSGPNHLDYFSTNLAANGHRLVSALRAQDGLDDVHRRFLGGKDRAALDEVVADATLRSYDALIARVTEQAIERRQRLLDAHRDLFYLTMAGILLIGVLIFRPMANMIARRTSELVAARNAMAFTAQHDALTGLYNRGYLMSQFDNLINDAREKGEQLAVLQLDLDRFKQINDTLGHGAGDLVLLRTAERMRAVSRPNDLCVRLGGDEFIMVMRVPTGINSIQVTVGRLLARINEPVIYNGAVIQPGASAGIALYPDDSTDVQDLMVYADLALYAAKRHGGGASSFFSGDLRRELDNRKAFTADITTAIADEAFTVFFQPQVDLRTHAVVGVEALVRWRHPLRGTVSPGIFLPVAEKGGLMVGIGRIVMRKAISEAARWHSEGMQFGRLAVNVTGAEIREPDFEGFVLNALRQAGLPFELFALEIVESVILDDEKTGIATKLRRMREAGIHLELDDFGTGYASLSHIDPGQIDRVKIDRRFVQDIDRHADNAKIVRAMTDLAGALGISVVAEGAETQAELDVLTRIGCTSVQGYAVAFPMPGQEASVWLTQHARLARPIIPFQASGA